MTVFVNGDPVDGFAVVVGPIGISLVMLHVNGVVIRLREAAGDRLNDAKKAIQKLGTEKRIVNEVMSDAVDVGIDHESVNESQNEHDPERRAREKEEESKEVGEMEKARAYRDGIPTGVGKQLRVGGGPVYSDGVSGHEISEEKSRAVV